MPTESVAEVLITLEDLDRITGKTIYEMLAKPSSPNQIDEEKLEAWLEMGTGHAWSIARTGWEDVDVRKLASDPAFRMHLAWITVALIAESKTHLNAADGRGKFAYQLERAEAWLVAAAKSQKRTAGERLAGAPAPVRVSHIKPAKPSSDALRFTFAQDPKTGRRPGGF